MQYFMENSENASEFDELFQIAISPVLCILM